jgi:hypothetical protein
VNAGNRQAMPCFETNKVYKNFENRPGALFHSIIIYCSILIVLSGIARINIDHDMFDCVFKRSSK